MRVIIIEDEWAIATEYEQILKSAFDEVECLFLGDGAKAEETHRRFKADLVITDLVMDSHFEGAYGVHTIRSFDEKVPILIISGHPKLAEFVDPFKTSKMLVKPIDSTMLITTVCQLLNITSKSVH